MMGGEKGEGEGKEGGRVKEEQDLHVSPSFKDDHFQKTIG